MKPDRFRSLDIQGSQGRLVSRNGHTFKRFAPLANEIAVALGGGTSPWVKIKNREYSQAVGRHEQFDGFRGEKRSARGT